MKKRAYQKGFSFIELMVVVTIMGFLSLGIARIFTSLHNENRKLVLKQNAQSVVTELRVILSEQRSCTTALIKRQRL